MAKPPKEPKEWVYSPPGGKGWGGPAKGASMSKKGPAPKFEVGNKAAAGPHDMSDRDKAQAIKDMLFGLALTAERPIERIKAGEVWLNRTEGLAVARNITVSADDIGALDDDALARRREEIERGLRQGIGGNAQAPNPPRSDGVVH